MSKKQQFTEKKLICRECGKNFIWTANEQNFFSEKGLKNVPTRCEKCRILYKEKHKFKVSSPIKCKECGVEGEISYLPKNKNDLILCENCFAKRQKEYQLAKNAKPAPEETNQTTSDKKEINEI
ncbi:MAG: zinc-ribbon domain containing protein [Patescibacteria group bacterium]|jgi:DNA-directed RNA polymerase subunit RPC12/RpoP